MTKKLGLYDSGLGGYTVFNYLQNTLPDINMVLYADTKHNPYGEKSREDLFKLACVAMDFFMQQEVTEVIVACNTISSTVLPEVKVQYPQLQIHGIIEITALSIPTDIKTITVVATPNTCHSHSYRNMLPNIKVQEIPMPTLAYEIEHNLPNYPHTIENISQALTGEALLLGCTHYPIAMPYFIKHFKGDIYDSNLPIYQLVLQLGYDTNTQGIQEVYVSGDETIFKQSIQDIFMIDQEVRVI